jgi:3-oxoacyl-[acyl-carrier protein] reductase
MELNNKVALVTGASKGIGSATAILLAKSGVDVIVNYNSDEIGASKVKKEIEKYGRKALVVQANISDEGQVGSMYKKIRESFPNGVDILVNNAAIFDESDSPSSISTFKNIINTNFLGQIYVTNEFLKICKRGKIVFISSVHGIIGHGRPDSIAYSALKAALDSYMKNLAKSVAPKILVNSVAPGKTVTPMWGDMDPKTREMLAQDHLTNKWVMPEEIADGVLFLLKNDSVCGEILTIDGGMSIKTLG